MARLNRRQDRSNLPPPRWLAANVFPERPALLAEVQTWQRAAEADRRNP